MQTVLTEAIPEAIERNGGIVEGIAHLVVLCNFGKNSGWYVRRVANGLAEQGVIEIRPRGNVGGRGHRTLYILPRKHQRQKRIRKPRHE